MPKKNKRIKKTRKNKRTGRNSGRITKGSQSNQLKPPGELPFVSICTPTYNRAHMLDAWAKYVLWQDYPKDKIEVLVADDSTDNTLEKLEELKAIMPNLKVFHFEGKSGNGIKRQWLIERSKGDIIVHFDDDDYYPPQRVSHAVKSLQESNKLLAGSTILYMWHVKEQRMTRSGPFHQNHATNATFAFKGKYTKTHRFADVNQGTEPSFTNGFSEPMVQLDPLKTMICIDHGENTVNKKKTSKVPVGTDLTKFIKDIETLKLYLSDFNLHRIF